MSRSSLIEQLTAKKLKSALEFEYEKLWAPPIMSLFTQADIQELIRIATSIKYNGNINKKYELIDAVMKRRGFRKAHSGTNRVVYNFLENSAFIAKVAVDKVGMTDSPAEYINQQYFQPFCCKIFEVHPSGVIAFVERVNPISSIEEFISVADDVFNMMVTKIIGKYVVDDLGTRTYMNFGVRQNSNGYTFGPVIIDFPYVYELDGAKLKCQTPQLDSFTGMMRPCGGDIDYDAGFNHLICTKCGREYKAMDLAKDSKDVKFEYDSKDEAFLKTIKHRLRTRLIDNGVVIADSGRSSDKYLSKEEFDNMSSNANIPVGEMDVSKTYRKKRREISEVRQQAYTALQKQYYDKLAMKNPNIVRNVTASDVHETVTSDNSAAINHMQSDDYNNNRFESVMEVAETVDKNGNVIDAYALTDALEKATFPELTPGNEYVLSSTDDNEQQEIEDKLRAHYEETVRDEIAPTITRVEHPSSVYSDEDVSAIIKKMSEPSVVATDNTTQILDPESDKVPENSPIIRPYPTAIESVSVLGEPKTVEEQQLTSSEDEESDLPEDIDYLFNEEPRYDGEPPESYYEPIPSRADKYRSFEEDYDDDDDGRPKKRKNNKRNKKKKKHGFNDNNLDEY